MASYEIKLQMSDADDTPVSSQYFDVDLYTEGKTIKAHKLILARRSPWFHKIFQSQPNNNNSAVAFFNVGEKLVETVVDILYEKPVILSDREKPRLIPLLKKLGISVTDTVFPTEVNTKNRAEACIKNVAPTKLPEATISASPSPDPQPSSSALFMHPPSPSAPVTGWESPTVPVHIETYKEVVKKPSNQKEVVNKPSNQNDFYAILDEFTETSDTELERIGHMLLGRSGDPDRMYKCMKCPESSKFFTQAEKHHRNHEFELTKPIREKLIKAELDRQNDVKSIHKLEKAIGTKDKKVLIKAFRKIEENLTSHLEILDGISQEKSKLPARLSEKCKEYCNNLTKTADKVDQLLKQLGEKH